MIIAVRLQVTLAAFQSQTRKSPRPRRPRAPVDCGWHDLSHERQAVQVEGDEGQHRDHAEADDDRGGSLSGDLTLTRPERMRSWSALPLLGPQDQQHQRRRQALAAMSSLVGVDESAHEVLRLRLRLMGKTMPTASSAADDFFVGCTTSASTSAG